MKPLDSKEIYEIATGKAKANKELAERLSVTTMGDFKRAIIENDELLTAFTFKLMSAISERIKDGEANARIDT